MILVRQDLTPGLLAEQKSIDFAIMKVSSFPTSIPITLYISGIQERLSI